MRFWNVIFVVLALIVVLAYASSPQNGSAALTLAIGLLVYFIPSYVAARRRVVNEGATQVVNFFLGWTVVGWVAALVVAVSAKTHDQLEAERPAPVRRDPMKKCPQCAEQVQLDAKICRYCRHEFKSSAASEPAAH